MLAEAADRAGSESVAMMERIAASAPPQQALQAMMRAYLSKAHVEGDGDRLRSCRARLGDAAPGA